MDSLIALRAAAPKLANGAAAKSGVALGLAALLGAQNLVPGVSRQDAPPPSPLTDSASGQLPAAEAALAALEKLALEEADPGVRRMAAWGLACACQTLRSWTSSRREAPLVAASGKEEAGGIAPGNDHLLNFKNSG